MLSVDEALEKVLSHSRANAATTCALSEALGLVLAEDVASDVDSPPYDKSIVDGFAVRSADIQAGRSEFAVLEMITAGMVPSRAVAADQTSRIMTGAPIPAGADAVIMVEQSELSADGQRVRLSPPKFSAGQNIMKCASSMRRGEVVLPAGRRLRSIEIGVLAEVGRASVQVVRRPSVGVLSTGNELVPPSVVPTMGQIRNSNGSLLAAATQAAGAVPVDLGIARDEPASLREAIARGLECDVLTISGGVSAGVLDLVPGVLRELGVEEVFHKVRLKPGKPLWFGVCQRDARQTLVFGLPGNPVSSFVCFELFVLPALGVLAGGGATALERVRASLTAEFSHRGDRPTYHPAQLTADGDVWRVDPLRWKGSGDLRTLVGANALACFPAGEKIHAAGESIDVLRL